MKRVFISYSWNDDEYIQRVVELSNKLSLSGYDVYTDKRALQEEYSPDLNEMMHRNVSEADKVIVLLSNGYKIKAEKFAGGVGQEFRFILSDIYNTKKKYILCCLDEFTSTREIAPLAFQSRYIYSLAHERAYEILKDMIEDRLDHNIINGMEQLTISAQYTNDIYKQLLSDPCISYFHYLANAGRVYERISELNIKIGNWNPENGWDHTCIYFIATQIKDKYNNHWTSTKTICEVASDIFRQMKEHVDFMNSQKH